jgi:Fur family ferric uptake transcriptional regulator
VTISPDSPPLQFENLAEAIAALRDLGLRISTPRRLILEALFAAAGPVSAVHLAQALSIDESSVYRNLDVFEGHGVVRHVHLGHGPGLYVLLGRGETEYLYCSRCSKVTAIASDLLDDVRESIRRSTGYETRFTHFAIVGVCEPCSMQSPEIPGGQRTFLGNGDDTHSHGDSVHSHSGEPTHGLVHQDRQDPDDSARRRSHVR